MNYIDKIEKNIGISYCFTKILSIITRKLNKYKIHGLKKLKSS